KATAAALVQSKGCAACHPGLEPANAPAMPWPRLDPSRGCLAGTAGPRYTLDAATRQAITAYLPVAARERHPSPFADRQRLLQHLGCVRCHQRDSDRLAPLDAAGSTLGGAWLQYVSFQRAPRLSFPCQKFTRAHLRAAVRDGVQGLRPGQYTY